MTGPPTDILFSEAAIAARVEALAQGLTAYAQEPCTVVALLQGALPFAADLLRALARRGAHPVLDCLWLESYRDARESSGRVSVRADVSRSVEGRRVLLVDDVFDSGRTLAFARAHVLAKGAREAAACAMVRKPCAGGALIEHVGFEAPERFLVGYGMDDAGRWRGLPYIAALPLRG
jgi:hypoxanthine phosphoribosyltransferase